jgi:hypothetical protein
MSWRLSTAEPVSAVPNVPAVQLLPRYREIVRPFSQSLAAFRRDHDGIAPGANRSVDGFGRGLKNKNHVLAQSY